MIRVVIIICFRYPSLYSPKSLYYLWEYLLLKQIYAHVTIIEEKYTKQSMNINSLLGPLLISFIVVTTYNFRR